MIECVNGRVEEELDRLVFELRSALDDFGHWSVAQKLPVPVVTCILRTKAENAAIYGGQERFSWHLPYGAAGEARAMDLRTKHYTPKQKARVVQWWCERFPDSQRVELIHKPHGTGPHLHLALKTVPRP